MAQLSDQVRVGFDGALYSSAVGTAAPTSASSVLASPWEEVGYITEDGVTVAHADTFAELKAWQRAAIVRKTLTAADITLQFAMMETNKQSVELYYKKELETDLKELMESSPAPLRKSFILDLIDGSRIHRMYIPEGEVTGRGDLLIKSGDAIAYNVTLTAYETNGLKVHHFWDSALAIVKEPDPEVEEKRKGRAA